MTMLFFGRSGRPRAARVDDLAISFLTAEDGDVGMAGDRGAEACPVRPFSGAREMKAALVAASGDGGKR
jgi:hypothetical protein